MRRFIILFALVLAACGGGSDDENTSGSTNAAAMAGVWRGTFVLATTTCDWEADAAFDAVDTVNQDGSRIVLDVAESGNVYEGTTTSENSFVAARQDPFQCYDLDTDQPIPGSTAVETKTVEYSNVQNGTAFVTYTYEESNCSGNTGSYSNACTVVWEGTFTQDNP